MLGSNPFEGIAESLEIKPIFPDFSLPKIPIPKDLHLASEFHHRLVKWINDFDASLDEAHEVGVRLVNFGQTITFHLHDISYWNPALISFCGITDDGNPVELIQHVTQISVLLMKLARKDQSVPKKRIGFASEADSAADADGG